VDKKGKAYQGYITWKPGEKPAFMFPKDYKAALEEGCVKPAVENEVQVAVNSEGKTVEATRNLKEALQSAQQRPTGEQKQQQERRQEQKEDRKQAQKQEQPDKPKRSRGVRR
jgi:thiamine pyrophosphate-dependent acetolactate synthase large subunit-like protein